jgi:hypothetical protein
VDEGPGAGVSCEDDEPVATGGEVEVEVDALGALSAVGCGDE